jgi:prepilin-type N-terminal cleavage/methylation domain-containing protein
LDYLNKYRQDDSGFTLVELMIVIVVIAILTLVAIPGLSNTAENGRRSANLQNISTIEDAAKQYNMINPIGYADLTELTPSSALVLYGKLESVPQNPWAGQSVAWANYNYYLVEYMPSNNVGTTPEFLAYLGTITASGLTYYDTTTNTVCTTPLTLVTATSDSSLQAALTGADSTNMYFTH